MEKIVVIGCPGSGKSTLSVKLSQITGMPLYHLDMMNWNPDRTTVSRVIFRQRLAQVLERDRWIIDGNYASTMEMRLAACDTVIFLDYPTDVCIDGIRSRRGKPRQDMPWVESDDEEDDEFIRFVESYNDVSRPKVYELLRKCGGEVNIVILSSRAEAERYLESLSSGGK